MKHRALFELKIEHPFSDDMMEYVSIKPDILTEKLLDGNGLFLKKTLSGFKVIAPIRREITNEAIFRADEKLTFRIFSISSDFLDFTDFSTTSGENVTLFSNQLLNDQGGDLSISEASKSTNTIGFPEVGKIEIALDHFETGTQQETVLYKAKFKSKSMIWKYYFITKEEADVFSIKNKDIIFQKLTNELDDTVFNSLKINFEPKGLQIRAFESQEALECRQLPRKDIQLKNDSTTIMSHLPNPVFSEGGVKIIRIN